MIRMSPLEVEVNRLEDLNSNNNLKKMEKLFDEIKSGMGRAEYIEVEPNVHLHITDAGEGRPVVLIPGWPLSDEMYEYQYNDLINKNFRVIGITLRGFGKSDKPYGSCLLYTSDAADE